MIVVCVNDNNELFRERSWDEILGVTPEEAITYNRAGTVAISFQHTYSSAAELVEAKKLAEETIAGDTRVLEHLVAVHGTTLVVTVTKEWENAG
jgi:hypothetical protein